MTEEQIKCRKAYYSIAKERCPFTDEDLQNGYYEGFVDGASEMARKDFEATKELQEENKQIYEKYRGVQDLLAVEMARSMKYEKQIEKMKCCQNCCHCNGGITDEAGNSICDSCDDDMSMWEY